MALRRLFGHEREEVSRCWRKLHNDELCDLHFSPSIIRVMRLKRMRWVGHVACMGSSEIYTGFWSGNLKERDRLENLDIA
jgi:hypothetical protein